MGFDRSRHPWKLSPVFRYAFALAGNPTRPKLCFISTGSGDKQASIDAFYAAFEGIEVQTSHLALFDKPNTPDVASHLYSQDVVWVDRGSVVNLLAVWRAHGLDTILRTAWQSDVVLGGESAGSLCWFEGGTTDSFGAVRPFTDGLCFLPYSNAVHYGDRRDLFHDRIKHGELSDGYASAAGAGLHFEGTELVKAIGDRKNAGAYKVMRLADGSLHEEVLEVELLKR